MRTKADGVRAADAAIASYRAQIAELDGERASLAADRQVIAGQLQSALCSAAAAVLPDASPETLARAAQELSAPWLLGRRQELEHQRAHWQAQLHAIEHDAQFVDRERLLHPHSGAIAHERAQCERLKAEIEAHRARFGACEAFVWLNNRELQRQMNPGGFSSFWDTVTFGGYREDKAKLRAASELGYASYDDLLRDHQGAEARWHQCEARIRQLDAQRQRLLQLLEEHGKLYAWTHDFEGRLVETLRDELARAIGAQDLRTVSMRIRPEARGTVARAHALRQKLEYLGQLETFVAGQSSDRHGRVTAIEKTRLTWALKPWDRLTGNKANWLIALPQAKRESTHKQLRWSRRMHQGIADYDDYDDYALYLWTVDDFLPYDAFAWGSDEPMPHEGFARGVLPDLARHRHDHQLERADYSAFRAADREDARHHEELADAREHMHDEAAASEGLAEAAAAVIVADQALDMADTS
jgi:hypothetical protein